MKRLLMLCDVDTATGETFQPCVVSALCTVTKRIEPAGRSFLDKHETRVAPKQSRKKCTSPAPNEEDEPSTDRTEAWKAKGNNKSTGGRGGGCNSSLASGTHLKRILAYDQTLYQILGVAEDASLDEIKKQYRKKVLEYHPDKAKSGGASPAADASSPSQTTAGGDSPRTSEHEAFLKIQEAYEALSDSNFRKQYDSSLPFDESIPNPSECEEPANFYAVFGAAFHRNARWSTRRPVPSLGDGNTPMAAVEKFYEFWFDFQFWRDFGVHDEHDLNEAECREERRWMERENAKIRKKYLKNERARIQKLVETAHAADPRIQRQKEEERKKRDEERAAKQRAHEAQMKEAAERKKREEEQTLRREEEAKELLKRQQQERQTQKKWRQKFRWFYRRICEDAAIPEKLDATQVQDLSMQLGVDELLPFCQRIHECLKLDGPVHDDSGDPCGPTDLAPSEQQRELVSRFYAEQWKICQDAKRSKEQAAEQEMQRLQEEKRRQELERKNAQEAVWTVNELSLLAKGLRKFPGGTARRWQQIAHLIGTKTQDEVVQKAKEMANGASLKAMGSKITQEVLEQQSKASSQATMSSAVASTKGTDSESLPSAIPGGETGWNQEQQTALERALAKHPSSMPAGERWTAIANEVPGKSRKECVERFKQIRAAILGSKSS